MSNYNSETYELGQVFALVTEALLRAEVVTNSPKVTGQSKHWVKTCIINRLNGIKNDLIAALPAEEMQMMKDDILMEETALQFTNVKTMFLSLDKEQRDEVESFIESLKIKPTPMNWDWTEG